MDLPSVGEMSSTNSANPIACSAGLAVIEEIQNKKLIQNTKIKGKILFKELNKIMKILPEAIESINGEGLIAAIIFKETKKKNIRFELKK